MSYTVGIKGSYISIPDELREKMGYNENTKLQAVFEDGKLVIESAASVALREIGEVMMPLAAAAGFNSEEDVIEYCKELRRETWKEYREKHKDFFDKRDEEMRARGEMI